MESFFKKCKNNSDATTLTKSNYINDWGWWIKNKTNQKKKKKKIGENIYAKRNLVFYELIRQYSLKSDH